MKHRCVRLGAAALAAAVWFSCRLFAADEFHLFAETVFREPHPLVAELDGLPPARPLESLEGGLSLPAGSGPATTVPLPPYPQERNFGLAAAEVIGLELLPWAFNRYVSNRDAAYISFRTIKSNYQTGFTYDRDAFTTNLALHPFHGVSSSMQPGRTASPSGSRPRSRSSAASSGNCTWRTSRLPSTTSSTRRSAG